MAKPVISKRRKTWLDWKEEKILAKLNHIIDKYQTPDALPSVHSKHSTEEEKYEIRWITNMRQAKKGRSSAYWYAKLDKVAKEKGWAEIFNIQKIDSKQNAISRFQYIIDNYTPDNPPTGNSDAAWLSRMRKIKQGKEGKWYRIYDTMAVQNGWQGIFSPAKKGRRKKNV